MLQIATEEMTAPPNSWRVAGTYYETCNCQAICPCRRHNRRPGGRSTYDLCQFLLSWRITEGVADRTDLAGRLVAMAGFYSDDEAGSPWRIVLYVDEAAGERAFAALKAIFLGEAGGNHFFAAKLPKVIDIRRAVIGLDHTKGRETIAVGDFARGEVERPAEYDGTVTCAIPGHHHIGQESVSRSTVTDGRLTWSYEGRCGFATAFEYRS